MPEDLLALILAQQRQIQDLVATVQQQAAALAALAPAPALGSSLTVAALRDAYDVVVKTRDVSLKHHLAPWVAHFAQRPALSLRASDLVAFRDGPRAGVTERGKPRGTSTRNAEGKAFLAMLNWGVSEGHLARNPIGKIKRLPEVEHDTTVAREDEPAVMRVATDTMRALFVLGVDVGMRLNEMRLLEWAWVDMVGKRISLPAWLTKTRKARKPRITARAVDCLRQLPRNLTAPWVFTNSTTGKPYSKGTIELWWRTICAETDIDARFHDLRHTAATRINAVAGFKVAMKQLGQNCPAVALKYVHSTETDLDDMRDKLDVIAGDYIRSVHRVAHVPKKNQGEIDEIG